MTDDSGQILVVFAGQSERWAKWAEEELIAAGFVTEMLRWDPLRRPVAGSDLHNLLAGPARILVILDDWYMRFDSGRYQAWAGVLDEVLPAHRGRLVAINVTTRPLPAAVRAMGQVGLRGVGREEARRRLLGLFGVRRDRSVGVPLGRESRFPDELPEVWNVPRRNRRFTGRTANLERLHDTLANDPSGTTVVALYGPAGLGKSQMALEYAHRYAGEYDIVWWVGASTTHNARDDFAALAVELGVAVGGKAELKPLINEVHRALRTGRRRWLIILDGAEEPGRLADLLPEGGGDVLITTHKTAWSVHGAELLALPRFTREESVAFASRRAPRLAESEANRLAAELEDMPLLIDQMAAWLDVHPMTTVSSYVKDISEGSPSVLGILPSGNDPRSFQAVWAKTLNGLNEDTPEAYELLKLFSRFSPDVVPVGLLRSARAADLPSHLARLIVEPSYWNAALRTLAEATSMWAEYETGDQQDVLTVGTLRMHRLFHRFVGETLPPRELAEAAATASRVLVAADPRMPTSPLHWARYAGLIPHLRPSGALESTDEDVRQLVLNCVEYLRMRGEYDDGLAITEEALRHWRADSGPTDRSVLVATHQNANMLRRLGRYKDAEKVGRQTLQLLADTPDARGIEILRARNGLGGTLMALGSYDEAQQLYDRAALDATELLGDSPRTLAIRSNLATATALQGHYEEALTQHRAVLDARVGLLGGKNDLTLLSALLTAWMLRLLSRYTEALAIQEQNTRLHSQILDRNHSQTLLAQHNLALCMRREGNLGYAQALMRSVRERQMARRGAQHPETLLVSTDYAMLLRNAGDKAQARVLAESTAELYADQLGERHPFAIGAYDNCGVIRRDMGDARGALLIAEDTTARMTAVLGDAHVWSIGCAMNSTAALAACGDVEGAAELGRDALTRAVTAVGRGHVLSVNLMAGLAQDLRTLGRGREADELECEAVRQLTLLLGEEHPQTRYMLERERPYWDFEPQPY